MISILMMMRPLQWIKNIVCVAPLFFAGQLFDFENGKRALLVVILFTLMAVGVYIFNDLVDRGSDRKHPRKKFRPIARGAIKPQLAGIIGVVLITVSLVVTYQHNVTVFAVFIFYLLLNVAYTYYLKTVPVIDVICISFGFVARLLAGSYIIEVEPTAWGVLVTFFLALFIGFNKRRAEYIAGGELTFGGGHRRIVLKKYDKPYLDLLVNSSTLMVILSYSLFAIISGKNPTLVLTLPAVFYGIMHYNYMVMSNEKGEEPEKILFGDWRIWLTIIIWFITSGCIFYTDIRLFQPIYIMN